MASGVYLANRIFSNRSAARRCELLLALADARDHAGEFREGSLTGERAFEIARDLGDPELIARAALAVAGRFDFGPPYDQGCRQLEAALEALGDREVRLRCRVLARLAITSPYRDSMETRLGLAEHGLASIALVLWFS